MALPTLNWKKLPVVSTAVNLANSSSVTILLNQVANMLTGSSYFDSSSRSPGTGSAWTLGGTYTIGTNTEAIWCTPPTVTSLSQSVIIAGRNVTGTVSSGTPTLMTHEQGFQTNLLYVGVSKYSGTFTNWTGSKPMGPSSSFSGFGMC